MKLKHEYTYRNISKDKTNKKMHDITVQVSAVDMNMLNVIMNTVFR